MGGWYSRHLRVQGKEGGEKKIGSEGRGDFGHPSGIAITLEEGEPYGNQLKEVDQTLKKKEEEFIEFT